MCFAELGQLSPSGRRILAPPTACTCADANTLLSVRAASVDNGHSKKKGKEGQGAADIMVVSDTHSLDSQLDPPTRAAEHSQCAVTACCSDEVPNWV